MSSAPISMSAIIPIPDDGFDLSFLKERLKKVKAPATSKMHLAKITGENDPQDVEHCLSIQWMVE